MFASDVVRYVGEPVAAVAADHPETCRRALAAIVVDYELLDPLLDPEAAIDGSHPPIHPEREPHPSPAHRVRRPERGRRRRRRGHLRDRHAGPGVPRARGGARRARSRRQGRRAPRRHPVAPRGPPPDRRLPRPARRGRPARARRRRRRVRGPRGHQPAGPHVSARAAARAAGAHRLQPRRELPRPRPPPPGDDLDAPPRHDRGRDRQDRGAHGVRRRGVRLHVVGGTDQRHHPHPGPVPLRQRRRRRVRRADEPPAVWGDAGFRGRAGVLRPRIADGPAGRRLRARSGRDPPAQRDADRAIA